MSNPEKIVVRVIITNPDKSAVLLGKRARGIGVGQWAVLGGKPKAGEPHEKTALREIAEETNDQLIMHNLRYWNDWMDYSTTPEDPWSVICFTAIGTGTLLTKNDEVSEFMWATEEMIGNLSLASDNSAKLREFFVEHRNTH